MTRWRTMHRRRRRQYTKDQRIILEWLKRLGITFQAELDRKFHATRIWMNDELVWEGRFLKTPDQLWQLAKHPTAERTHALVSIAPEQRLTLATAIHLEDH